MTKRLRAKYKIDRRLGENIWGRPKSPVNKREYGPGEHGRAAARRESRHQDGATLNQAEDARTADVEFDRPRVGQIDGRARGQRSPGATQQHDQAERSEQPPTRQIDHSRFPPWCERNSAAPLRSTPSSRAVVAQRFCPPRSIRSSIE